MSLMPPVLHLMLDSLAQCMQSVRLKVELFLKQINYTSLKLYWERWGCNYLVGERKNYSAG